MLYGKVYFELNNTFGWLIDYPIDYPMIIAWSTIQRPSIFEEISIFEEGSMTMVIELSEHRAVGTYGCNRHPDQIFNQNVVVR